MNTCSRRTLRSRHRPAIASAIRLNFDFLLRPQRSKLTADCGQYRRGCIYDALILPDEFNGLADSTEFATECIFRVIGAKRPVRRRRLLPAPSYTTLVRAPHHRSITLPGGRLALNFESGNRLRIAANLIADATVARDYTQRPALLDRYGEDGRTKYRQDILYDVAALSAAVDAGDVGIFLRYAGWLKTLLVHRGVAAGDIAESLRCMASVLAGATAGDHLLATSHLQTALERFDSMPTDIESFIGGASEEHAVARQCLEGLLRLDAAAVRESLESAMAAGLPVARIYTGIIPPLMREVGRRWQMNEISVAHEHYCSAAMQSILGSFHGLVFGAATASGRSILVACVEGEQHELGARTVADVFALNGWHTSFLGANLPVRELVSLIIQAPRRPDLIALSATMPEQLVRLGSTITAIRDSSDLPIMVGGYLFEGSLGLAAQLEADGCADDAEAALAIADGLVPPPA